MRRIFSWMLAGPLLAPTAALALSVGDTIPANDAKMLSTTGGEVSISDVAGKKGTLVIFTSNTCPYARAWEGRFAALGNLYAKSGIGVIAINPSTTVAGEDLDAMVGRAKEQGFEFPYAVDATSAVAHAFGATKTPEVFVFGARGRLVYHGAVDDEAENPHAVESPYLRRALDAVLEGKAAVPAETKVTGCSIEPPPAGS